MIPIMRLGSKLRARRLALGWTLETLSEASGVDVGTISAIETRNSERSKYFPALSKALGVTIEELMSAGATEQPAPPGRHHQPQAAVDAMEPVSLAIPNVTLDLPAECLLLWHQLEKINPERRRRLKTIIAFEAAREEAYALGLTEADLDPGSIKPTPSGGQVAKKHQRSA